MQRSQARDTELRAGASYVPTTCTELKPQKR